MINPLSAIGPDAGPLIRFNAVLRRLALLLALLLVLPTVSTPAAAQSQRCFALEKQLQQLSRGGSSRQASASRIRAQLSRVERQFRQTRARLERGGCYSTFFFTTTVKNTARCRRLDRSSRRLEGQRNRLRSQLNGASRPTNTRAKRDQIVRALARNRCGRIYQREARRIRRNNDWNPFASVFKDGGFNPGGFFDNAPRELPPEDGIRVGSTYRTMCVRQCDGYYYPVSFSTLPNRFQKDAAQCASSCAAPTELFIYRNPGAEVEQMVSLDGRAYSKIPNAFRYRKEYIKGCSCRSADYDPAAGTEQAAATQSSSSPAVTSEELAAPEDAEGGNGQPAPPKVQPDDTSDAIERPVPAKPANEASTSLPDQSSTTVVERPIPPKPEASDKL